MNPALPRRRAILGLALLPLVAGCTATAPPRFFTLAPRPPVAPASRSSASVMVKSVELAKYLDRPQIVRYADAYELKMDEFERWGEGMRDMVTRVLVENLSMRLPGSQVYAGSGALTLRPDLSVEVEIGRFDADPDNAVILAAQWAVQRENKRSRVKSDRIRIQATSADTAQLVAAMSDALGELADHVALELTA